MAFKEYVFDVIEKKRPGISIVRALSFLYFLGVKLRNFAYEKNILKRVKVEVPVISIGNIVAGGTGKTPLVKMLAEELSHSFQVAILSRGYGSELENSKKGHLITVADTAQRCGDEPYWFMTQLPKVQVWVGKNRIQSAKCAIAKGASFLILDDGLQYRRLKRDVEIIAMDGNDLMGKDNFLPLGLLRDDPVRLKEADLIVVKEGFSEERIFRELSRYTSAPIVIVKNISGTDLSGKSVGVFCAIGNPQRFLKSVEGQGGSIRASYFKRDHEPFSTNELSLFAKLHQLETLVCTEKDFVKLPKDALEHLPIIPLTSSIEIIKGKEHWDALLLKIKSFKTEDFKAPSGD